MSYNKTAMFFFLKPENYYRQDFVRKIRSLKNGFEYLTLYEEILTDTLNKEGVLANFYGDEIVPYTIDELSTIFQHKPSIIKNGLELFEKYKMIEKNDDGAYFIPNALEFTKRTTVGSVKKKEQRNNKKLKEQDESEVDICPSVNEEECLTNIDKEININIKRNVERKISERLLKKLNKKEKMGISDLNMSSTNNNIFSDISEDSFPLDKLSSSINKLKTLIPSINKNITNDNSVKLFSTPKIYNMNYEKYLNTILKDLNKKENELKYNKRKLENELKNIEDEIYDKKLNIELMRNEVFQKNVKEKMIRKYEEEFKENQDQEILFIYFIKVL